jgi:nitrogen fixation/metabolism regulation signal transduction histidine kinase
VRGRGRRRRPGGRARPAGRTRPEGCARPGGRVIPPFRRLESRLLASFLLLAAIPSLLLTLVATGAVRWAVDKIQSPSIEESFWSATALSRELRARLLRDAGAVLDRLAAFPPSAADEDGIRALLRAQGASFAAWSAPGGGAVVDVDPRGGSGHPSPEDWDTLARGASPPERRADAIRVFAPDEAGPARAVGFRLDPATANALGAAGEDYTRYRQLFVWEAVWKRALFLALAATLLVTVAAAYGAARATARRISRPVVSLARSADRLADGDLSHRANVAAEGEIADLVRSFNRMSEQLERSRDDLLRMERIAAWRDVARRVAHEIRNPLTPIRLAVHRLGPRLAGDAGATECLGSIAEEIENLERLSATFADFAKLPEAKPERVDLARIASGVVELHRDVAPGVTVEYDGPESLPVLGDRDLLRRAATNLVKNAADALAGRGGRVIVRVRAADGRAALDVEDDGPGVPREIRETLGRPGVSGKPGGSGLGLAMVQRIAADHRGRLAWRSDARGTAFTIEIPALHPEGP